MSFLQDTLVRFWGLPNAAEMERLAQRVVAEGLSVRATEELVALHEEPEPGPDQPRVLRARSTPLPALHPAVRCLRHSCEGDTWSEEGAHYH